ncbi:Retinol dehydrogenase 12 [Fasciola hepatica]|uniref:Retinol dehydrogenase 12 n=1 Tax=Fasciola hepatica TaxID=6192 RepID=A0A4E0RUH8_FASHE|nr:Retinol dehydrogenase 12 [Fasciola hepatica]
MQTSETSGWWNRSCKINKVLNGKIIIVTGANTGHGLALTTDLARRGGHVIMACRSVDRANTSRDMLIAQYGTEAAATKPTATASCFRPIHPDQLEVEQVDLSSFSSVRDFVQRIQKKYIQIHYLFNNAGIVCDYAISEDGHEMTMAVNHLAHVLLTVLLLPLLHAGAPSRIVFIGSRSQYMGRLVKPDLIMPRSRYGPYAAYCQSKLATGMFAKELGMRLRDTGILACYVDPGPIDTEIVRDTRMLKAKVAKTLMHWFFKSADKGAQTAIYAALSENIQPGGFYFNCRPCDHGRQADDAKESEWLFNKSCELVGVDIPLDNKESQPFKELISN